MKIHGSNAKAAAILRLKAEELQKKRPAKSLPQLSEAEMHKLIHELEVHQIELEMQNKELVQAMIAAEDAIALYDFAPSGYFTLSKERTIAMLNLCGAQMLGKERMHLIDNAFGFFISDDTKADFNIFMENIFSAKTKETCEVTLLTKGNKPMFVQLSGIVTKNGEECLLTMVDISERKQADEKQQKYEERLRQTQKLESLGILAGGIAHDFNNLMGGIFGYIDMALESSTDEKVTKRLFKAMNAMERAKGLTQQLITFAKGGAPIQKIDHLFPFVQETAQFALCGANISCDFDVPKDLWACNFDKNQIGQVIDNLIINAQQAMPVGGAIELTACNIVLAEKEHPLLTSGNYVKIAVKDTGIGISKELIPNIFDPFFTTKAKGHGLGLATCHSIIHRHGGCIDVESEPDKGSTFKVYLPATVASVSAEIRKTENEHKGNGTFLIMDDEELMRDTIGDMLETLGYTVVSKENGKDAIEFFESETNANRKITGIIFDLTVPGGMGGKAAIVEIRKLNKEIVAFVASGYADDPVMKNPAEYGFTASICKPFRKYELCEMLNKYMQPNK